MVKIRIKPKIEIVEAGIEITNERQRERQEDYCEEIRSLRCEVEMMKTTMDEMREYINEMQMQMQMQMQVQSGDSCRTYSRIRNYMNGTKCENSVNDFGEWTNGLDIMLKDMETMFESKDIVDWASKFIVADLKQKNSHPYPICAIRGSRNEMIVYDKNMWRKMTDDEFLSTIVNKMFKKLLAVFTQWKNENYNRILTSEHFSTVYHSNYARILSFNENASKFKTRLFHMLCCSE
jgi:hypothetical protein